MVKNITVGSEIVEKFKEMSLIPAFFFVDPWGYKGLSLELINAVPKDWACECIFFFNYNRINMGLNNPMVKERIDALFGAERAHTLRRAWKASLLPGARSSDRYGTVRSAESYAQPLHTDVYLSLSRHRGANHASSDLHNEGFPRVRDHEGDHGRC